MSTPRLACAALVVLALAGCETGPKRYPVSGTITLGGQSVLAGEIAFEPDTAKGNTGPGSMTRIKQGRYQTEPGLGVVGGAYIVRITPMSGTPSGESLDGKPLLPRPYVVNVEFPTTESTKDFDIPDKAAKPGN